MFELPVGTKAQRPTEISEGTLREYFDVDNAYVLQRFENGAWNTIGYVPHSEMLEAKMAVTPKRGPRLEMDSGFFHCPYVPESKDPQWPFPAAPAKPEPDAEPKQSYVDYVKGVIRKYELDRASEAYDRAKRAIKQT